MKIIESSETFAQILNNYKNEKKHCGTNMLLMNNEINNLVDAGKLYYDLIEGILWFFVENDDFYIAYFYAPKGERLKLIPQELDVVVEIIGNQSRYNSQWEAELLETGFEKHNKNLEFMAKKEESYSQIKKLAEERYLLVEKAGCYRRSAKKTDYEAMYQMFRSKIDKYAVHKKTEKELDEMEQNHRGYLIFDDKNEIRVVRCYSRSGNTARANGIVSTYKGLGSLVCYESAIAAFDEGCDKIITWIWENNTASLKMWRRIGVETGKFSQQFLMRKSD